MYDLSTHEHPTDRRAESAAPAAGRPAPQGTAASACPTPAELDALPLDALEAHLVEVRAAIRRNRERARKHTLAAIRRVAREGGFSLAELVEPERRRADKVKGPARYRDPSDPTRVWRGVGRKPVWLRQALDDGHALEEFVNPDWDAARVDEA